jgi:hypothetical protein
MKVITEEEFELKYILIDNHFNPYRGFVGKMFETFGEEFEFITEMAKEKRVITIIETESDEESDFSEIAPNLAYISGLHVINRIGYLVVDCPLEEEFECLIY